MGGEIIGEDLDNEESWMNSVIYQFKIEIIEDMSKAMQDKYITMLLTKWFIRLILEKIF